MRKSLIAAVSAIALTMPSAGLMAQTDMETTTETEIETGIETEMGSDVDAETGIEADAGMEAEVEAETDGDTEAEADADMSTEPEAELTALEIETITGMSVQSRDGETIGEVVDVVSRADDQIVLISTGGFLGFGADTKAVSLADIAFDEESEFVVLAMLEEQFEALPDYEGEE